MTLEPKKGRHEERKAAPAGAAPVVEAGGFGVMAPKVPAEKRTRINRLPSKAETSRPTVGARGYRTVLSCRTKREPD